MARGIVGRHRELAAIAEFVAALDDAAAALLIEGEPGIGKTILWQAALDRAREASCLVLTARPGESEAALSFASLTDLLQPVAERVLPELPEPQRGAVEVALLGASPHAARLEQRAVAMGFLSALVHLAQSQPVVLAIDDLQWLDGSSALVLEFALRRLHGHHVGVLATRRDDGASAPGVDLERCLPEGSVQRLRPEPLNVATLHALVTDRLGRALPRRTLLQVATLSGGNPLFALEIARGVLAGAGSTAPGVAVDVPHDLRDLVGRRLRDLPEAVRELLLVAAASARPTTALLRDATGAAPDLLEEAERRHIVSIDRDEIRFTHPLLSSVLYAAATPSQRRRVHQRLAEVSVGIEARARHLALATSEPDAALAATLDAAVAAAEARGAVPAAVELAGLALQSTPPDDAPAAARTVRLADLLFRAGDAAAAEGLLLRLIDALPPSPDRAAAHVQLAEVFHETRSAAAAVPHCAAALAEAGDDRALRARILAVSALAAQDDITVQAEQARAALDLLDAEPDPDPRVLSLALLAVAEAEHLLGHPIPDGVVRRALELEAVWPQPRVADRFSAALGAWMKYCDEHGPARELLLRTYESARAENDESSLPYAVSHLPQLELWTGDWPRARAYAREHLEIAEQIGQPAQRVQALFNVALVHAHLGDVEEARAAVADGLACTAATGDRWSEASLRCVLGFLAWSLGDAPETVAQLTLARSLKSSLVRDPGYRRNDPDLIEALVSLGRRDEAAVLVDDLEARAREAGRTSVLAVAIRSRALLVAACGDQERALTLASEALAAERGGGMPFELGRTLLVDGQLRRRARQKRAARDSLAEAEAIFERLGARLWAAQARGELGRVGLRPRAPDGLTESERRVAELVAAGMTNRAIADRLFMSTKTVEANLSRVYGKLQIRSRAELGAHMAASAEPARH